MNYKPVDLKELEARCTIEGQNPMRKMEVHEILMVEKGGTLLTDVVRVIGGFLYRTINTVNNDTSVTFVKAEYEIITGYNGSWKGKKS